MTLDPNQPGSPLGTEPLPEAMTAGLPPQPIAPARLPQVKPSSSSRLLNALLVVAAVVALGGVAFAVGRATAPAAAALTRGNLPGGFFEGGPGASLAPGQSPVAGGFPDGQGGGIGGLGGGLTISGTITSLTGDSLTIETAAGQTVELGLDAETAYRRSTEASAADLSEGSNVEVRVDVATGIGRPTASADAPASLGTASSITVVP